MTRFDPLCRGLCAAFTALVMSPALGLDAGQAGKSGPASSAIGSGGATCALLGYVCSGTLTCRVLAQPPAAASGITSHTAYTCTSGQVLDVKATSCPTGLVAQMTTAPPALGSVTSATLRCVPPRTACPPFAAAWQATAPLPLDPPTALGYACRYVRAGR